MTPTGPGGVGRTRLAARTAARVGRAFPAGVHFVRPAALGAPGLVAEGFADQQIADRQIADRQIADRQIADRQIADRQIADRQIADRQIADRLVIARCTAEGHAERILGTFGSSNRSQIAAWVAARRRAGPGLPSRTPSVHPLRGEP
ncbi:hypothetical protein [Streptomyces sediminimaris]|uniref:hypothetical protein n=1 Tax=Streptomyces sediminimaris TaxID=3383721 RepID=UPI00399C335C